MRDTEEIKDINSVSDNANNDKRFYFGLVITLFGLLYVVYYFYPSNKGGGDDLEAMVEEKYIKSNRKIIIPDKIQKKKSLSNNNLPRKPRLPAIAHRSNSNDKNRARREEEKRKARWLKRRKAKSIIETSLKRNEPSINNKNINNNNMNDYNALSASIRSINSNKIQDINPNQLESHKYSKVNVKMLDNTSSLIAQGKIISCVLETAIVSDYAGFTRCITDENIFSYDGSKLILPTGSRVVGQYQAGVEQGKSRVFVIWSRIMTPDGIDVNIDSPGIDQIGRTGHDAEIQTHFFTRFGASALLSIVGGLSSTNNQNNNFQDIGRSFNKSAEIALTNSINIKDTAYKNQGDKINIFVARDLDFTSVFEY